MNEEQSLETRGETFFLNLRFMLIVTVFVGNMIEPLIGRMDAMHSLYMWIFSFHMPLFVLVTGYFGKKNLAAPAGRKVLLQIGLQYLIFQSLYSALDVSYFRVNHIHHSFFAPYLLLWFLAGHAFWRLLMLAIRRWSVPAQLIFAFAAGIGVGYLQLDGVWFAIARTFVFFPFFVIGYHLKFETILRMYRKFAKSAAAVLSVALLLVLGTLTVSLQPGWLYGSMTFMQLGQPQWYDGLYRAALYGLQIVSSLAFLGLVPFGMSRMTDWGRRTLYVFLLHGFIVRLAAASGLYNHIHSIAAASLLVAAALAMTILLAQPSVKRLLHPLVEPSVDWMITLQRAALRRSL